MRRAGSKAASAALEPDGPLATSASDYTTRGADPAGDNRKPGVNEQTGRG
jgi:hypothetical protein